MRRSTVVALAATLLTFPSVGVPVAWGAPVHPNGQLTFAHYDPALDSNTVATVNPDGTHLVTVLPVEADPPRWSPDGTTIAAPGSGDIMSTLIDVATGAVTELHRPPGLFMGCFAWSADGTRLACGSYNEDAPSLNGIFTVRASDGGGLTRITSNPGGEDNPGTYSPNGSRLEFARFAPDGSAVGLFVVNVNGTGLKRITPPGMLIDGDRFGDWSPQGKTVIFAAHKTADVRNTLWTVHADGTGLRELHIDLANPCGGSRSDPGTAGCFDATYSPDGKQIAFIVNVPAGTGESLYTANIDGSNVHLVTSGGAENPDWGTRPAN